MSYHIIVKRNTDITYNRLFESRYITQDVSISYQINRSEIIDGYSKLFLPGISSRGVALNTGKEEYDIELNVGAGKEDYYLATRVALALSEINNSPIEPEYDTALSLPEFEQKYDAGWADANRTMGISTIKYLTESNKETILLNGCKRGFCFGPYLLERFTADNPGEEVFADRMIECIRNVQFIETKYPGLHIPTRMEADFPEGVKTLMVVSPGFMTLICKTDYIILRKDKEIVKIPYEKFISYISGFSERLDEAQYILKPLSETEYLKMIKILNVEVTGSPVSEYQNESTKKKWWQIWK